MPSRFDDEARNVLALNLSNEGGDEAAQSQLKKRKRSMIRTRIVVFSVTIVAGAAIGVLVASRAGRTVSQSGGVAPWRSTVGLVMIGVALILEVAVIVGRMRSGELAASWRSPSLVLNWRQRRQLAKQIRGQRPVDQSMLPVTRQLATRMSRQRSLVGLWIALPLVFLGQALISNSAFRWWLAIGFLTLYLWIIVQTLRDSARAERFLAQHPEDAPAEPSMGD